MGNILNPFQFRHHLFFLLQILLIFLALVNFIFLKFLLNLIYFFMEKSTDIWFLLDQDLWCFVLDRADVIQDFLVQVSDLLQSISIAIVQGSFASMIDLPVYFISSWSSSMIFLYWISRYTNRCLMTMISSSKAKTLSLEAWSSWESSLHLSW